MSIFGAFGYAQAVSQPIDPDPNTGVICQVCSWFNPDRPDIRVYTANGVEIVIECGKDGRLIAYTKEHHPEHGVEMFELRAAMLRYIEELIPLSRRILPLVTFGALERNSIASPTDFRMYPPLRVMQTYGTMVLTKVDQQYTPHTKDGYAHVFLMANVFELRNHTEMPIHLADDYVHAAQEFVGYFYGQHVSSGQMTTIEVDERGSIDRSVKFTGDNWTAPFELEDDCPMCQRMTDESVTQRIDGFQWELVKEANTRLTAFPLDTLPHELKRALCIRWNHIVRDWLASDPRYAYRDGQYYVVWTEKIGGYDQRVTRSDQYGASITLAVGYYAEALADAARIMGVNPDDRDIWLGTEYRER